MTNEVIDKLIGALRLFAKERDWDQFHSPKNLASALCVEAAELLEQFQWLTEAESKAPSAEQRKAIGEEMADVFLFLLRLSDKLEIDVVQESWLKLELNAKRYPVEKARGKSTKYTKL